MLGQGPGLVVKKNSAKIFATVFTARRAHSTESTDYAVARCPSVRHTQILCLNNYINPHFFHCRVVTPF